MNITNRKILIVSPHTDDGEFGCGGTIAKLIDNSNEVYYCAFSCAEESLPDGFPRDTLINEVTRAVDILGIPLDNLIIHRFPVRKLNYHRQEILEILIRLRKSINPDLIFTPSTFDIHQDHQAVTNEVVRAFKNRSIFGYELPWNCFTFDNDCFVSLNEIHVETKINAIKQYDSQAGRSYSTSEYLKAHALTKGNQAGLGYAEVFQIIRLIL